MKTKKESKTKTPQLEVVNDIFMVEKNSRRLVSLKPDVKEAPENMVIPEGIEIIGSDIFVSKNKFQCSNIKSVKFPDSLKKIENNAFFRCTNLTDIRKRVGMHWKNRVCFMQRA